VIIRMSVTVAVMIAMFDRHQQVERDGIAQGRR
jgi:hypothetical protein